MCGVELVLDSEVFRFALIRPPKRVAKDKSKINPIHLPDDVSNGFIRTLQSAKSRADRDAMMNLASEFAKSTEFVDSSQKVDPKYAELAFVIRDNLQKSNNSYFEDNFNRIFSPDDASTVINSNDYRQIYERITNSIITAAIVSNVPNTTKSLNVFVVYALDLIKQLATNSLNSEKIDDSTIIIPKGIFPLPPVKNILEERYKKEQEQRKKVIDEHRQKIEETSKLLDDNNEAIAEVIDTFEKMNDYERKKSRGFILSREISNKISTKTKQILQNHGLSSDEIDVSVNLWLFWKNLTQQE